MIESMDNSNGNDPLRKLLDEVKNRQRVDLLKAALLALARGERIHHPTLQVVCTHLDYGTLTWDASEVTIGNDGFLVVRPEIIKAIQNPFFHPGVHFVLPNASGTLCTILGVQRLDLSGEVVYVEGVLNRLEDLPAHPHEIQPLKSDEVKVFFPTIEAALKTALAARQ